MASRHCLMLFIAFLISNSPLIECQNAFVTGGTSRTPYWGTIPKPSRYESPRFRWWMPGGWVDGDILVEEINAAFDAGFGGFEISDVQDSILNGSTLPPQEYGWAQPRWNKAILAAYETAAELDFHLDYTIGPHWPTGFPGYTADSPQTMKELVHGQVLITAGSTYSGALPLPLAVPSGQETANPDVKATPILVAVLVAQTTATNVNASVITFDQSTVQDVSLEVANSAISWTAPSSGDWILVAIWGRGTGQIENMYDGNPNAPVIYPSGPGLIVDHLSPAGVEATTNFWETNILTSELKILMGKVNASYFEDSLELKLHQYWSFNVSMLSYFESSRGYSLVPYLLYLLKDTNTFSGNSTMNAAIQSDWTQVITDLYVGNRIKGLQSWANGFGVKLRAQPYGILSDTSYACGVVDIPEGESLGFGNDFDQFRIEAAGRDVAGHTAILSDELGANFGEAYFLTWKDLLTIYNQDCSVGVTQAVTHGYPYRDSPTSLWPGYAPFTPIFGSPGFAEAWGTRQPQWMFASNASSYMAFTQSLLQSGKPFIDVAILNSEGADSVTWDDPALNLAGYSYQFPSPQLLLAYNAKVKGKRLGNPQYGALVINNQTGLNLDMTTAVYKYAKAGLPIVLVASVPIMIQGYSENYAKQNNKVAKIFSQIMNLPNTALVATEADVPAALASLGAMPSVRYSTTSSTFFTQRRDFGNGKSLFYIHNTEASATVSQVVSLAGTGYPMAVDLWTGNVIPIGVFQPTPDGFTNINITLVSGASQMIFLGNSNPYGATAPKTHVLASTGEIAVTQNGHIALRALSNGSFSATLANGKTKSIAFSTVGMPVTPSWTLTVSDWNPAQTGEIGLNSSLTVQKTLGPIVLETLTTWTNISGLENAAGIGYYDTVVSLRKPSGDEQQSGMTTGVYFDIGEVYGSWGLTVNGNSVKGIDQFANSYLDISDYVITGENRVTITLATPLWNKLIVADPSIWGTESFETLGVVGPVVFRYYQEAVVA